VAVFGVGGDLLLVTESYQRHIAVYRVCQIDKILFYEKVDLKILENSDMDPVTESYH